jgi:hypothetical protein
MNMALSKSEREFERSDHPIAAFQKRHADGDHHFDAAELSYGRSLARAVILVALVEQSEAFSARHGSAILRRDTFHLCPMSGFLVARITQHHAVIIESVQVTLNSFVQAHCVTVVNQIITTASASPWPHSRPRCP